MRVCHAIAFLTSADVIRTIKNDTHMDPNDKRETLLYLEMCSKFWKLLNFVGQRVYASKFVQWKADLNIVAQYFKNNLAIQGLLRKDVGSCISGIITTTTVCAGLFKKYYFQVNLYISGITTLFENLFKEYYFQADGQTPEVGWKSEMWLTTKRANQVFFYIYFF